MILDAESATQSEIDTVPKKAHDCETDTTRDTPNRPRIQEIDATVQNREMNRHDAPKARNK